MRRATVLVSLPVEDFALHVCKWKIDHDLISLGVFNWCLRSRLLVLIVSFAASNCLLASLLSYFQLPPWLLPMRSVLLPIACRLLSFAHCCTLPPLRKERSTKPIAAFMMNLDAPLPSSSSLTDKYSDIMSRFPKEYFHEWQMDKTAKQGFLF